MLRLMLLSTLLLLLTLMLLVLWQTNEMNEKSNNSALWYIWCFILNARILLESEQQQQNMTRRIRWGRSKDDGKYLYLSSSLLNSFISGRTQVLSLIAGFPPSFILLFTEWIFFLSSFTVRVIKFHVDTLYSLFRISLSRSRWWLQSLRS